MKLRANPATVIAQVRHSGGRLGSSAMMSHHAHALQQLTVPYSNRIGTNSQPVWTASATSLPTPMRATR